MGLKRLARSAFVSSLRRIDDVTFNLRFRWPRRKNGTVKQIIIEVRKTKPGFLTKTCIKHLFLLPALLAGIHQAAGQSALWKYKAICHQGDDRVGQWSDVVSIPVAG